MRVLLAAEEGAGLRALKLLSASPHQVAGVLSASAPCQRAAEELNLPLLPPERLKDPAFAAEAKQADVLLNVHSLYLVQAAVLEALRFGAFNLHPGPLPDYAGMNVPSWAILHGEARHGVTLHWMTSGIDKGAIAYQEMFDMGPTETGLSASLKCVSLGMKMVERLLDALATEPPSIPRHSQDLSRRRYFGRNRPFNGQPPLTLSAAELERLVRASDYHPFPAPWGTPCYMVHEREIGLLKVELTGETADAPPGTIRHRPDGAVWLALPDQWLAMQKVLADGRVLDPRTTLPDGSVLTTGTTHPAPAAIGRVDR